MSVQQCNVWSIVLQGFKLVFSFSENSFFSNKQLVKTYYMASDDDDTSPVLQKAVGTNIDWASGKNPGVKVRQHFMIIDQ